MAHGDGPSDLPMAARDRAVEALRVHFARDRIDIAEFERRTDRAYRARSTEELNAVLADLPALPEVDAAGVPAKAREAGAVKKRGFVVSVLGGSERRGPWTPPSRLLVMPVIGGVVLDFRDAVFTTGAVEVTVLSLLGAAEIVVPPDVRVEVGGVSILGAFEHRSGGAPSGSEGPLVRVNGVALLGGVEVKVLARDVVHRPDW